MSQLYDVWIREVDDTERVTEGMASGFGISREAALQVVSSAPVCVKKNVDEQTAKVLLMQLRKAGAIPQRMKSGVEPYFLNPDAEMPKLGSEPPLGASVSRDSMNAARNSLRVMQNSMRPGSTSKRLGSTSKRPGKSPRPQSAISKPKGREVSKALTVLREHGTVVAIALVGLVAAGVIWFAVPTSTVDPFEQRIITYRGRWLQEVDVWLAQNNANSLRSVDAALVGEWKEALEPLGVTRVFVTDWVDAERRTASTLMIDADKKDTQQIMLATKEALGEGVTVTAGERYILIDF